MNLLNVIEEESFEDFCNFSSSLTDTNKFLPQINQEVICHPGKLLKKSVSFECPCKQKAHIMIVDDNVFNVAAI
jgi:hypothetical protein